MQIEVAVLADCANVAQGEKLNVMGVFDRIAAPTFPAVHPFMVLVLRLRLDYSDGGGTHNLLVAMHDEDHREFFRAETKVAVAPILPGGSAHVNQILNFAGVGFTKPGQYFFHLSWDAQQLGSVVLEVQSLPRESVP